MQTKFCPDCGRIVTAEAGIEIKGDWRHRGCVMRKSLSLIGELFCGADEDIMRAVRAVRGNWQKFVGLLGLVSDKMALGRGFVMSPGQHEFLHVLFQTFVAPQFTAAESVLRREETRESEQTLIQ